MAFLKIITESRQIRGFYPTSAIATATLKSDGSESVSVNIPGANIPSGANVGWYLTHANVVQQQPVIIIPNPKYRVHAAYMDCISRFKFYWPIAEGKTATLVWLWHFAAAAHLLNTEAAIAHFESVPGAVKVWYGGINRPYASGLRGTYSEFALTSFGVYTDGFTSTGEVRPLDPANIVANIIIVNGAQLIIPATFDPELENLGIAA